LCSLKRSQEVHMTDVIKDAKEVGKDLRNAGREAAQSVQSDLKEAGRKMTDETGKDYDSIKADLDALRSDVAQLLKGLGREAGGTVDSVKETITEKAGDVKEVITDKAGDVKDMLEKRVQDQPLITLLGAFGVGLIVARLMR
jgi:ElaB/YqjD/DUF883 family membrane-anchored ribosome-binding protein